MSLEQKRIINQFVAEFGFDPFSSSGRQDKLREAALWKLLTEAREALWQPANPDLCGRIDEALAQQDAQAVPQHLADDERVAALCDLSYVAGMKAGWNFCISDDSDGFERRQNSVGEAIRILQSHRAPTPSQQDAQAMPQGEAIVEEFSAWLNERRGMSVAWVFHDVVAKFRAMLNAAPTPPAQQPLGWLDRKAVECLQGAELNWMPAWNRPSSPDPVPIFLLPPAQRVMLTDEEIEEVMRDYVDVENGLFKVHKALIDAYERKNGIK